MWNINIDDNKYDKKIPILRSILLDENGNDKPLTLKYTSQYFENNVLSFQMNEEGPKLYITKLPA